MINKRRGFTMIEVALFLAITGLLFAGVMVGVQNSIFQQRFNDSVQNFAEFLRTAYSGVTNVQNTHGGVSNFAIYGKLITFGIEKGNGDRNLIYSYDVIGEVAGNDDGGTTLEALERLGAGVAKEGLTERYSPRWGASIEKTDGYEPFVGAVLIVRHPTTGALRTFVEVGNEIDVNKLDTSEHPEIAKIDFKNFVTVEGEVEGEVDFCINPIAGEIRNNRRDVKIAGGATNGSGVLIIPEESEDNNCIKKD